MTSLDLPLELQVERVVLDLVRTQQLPCETCITSDCVYRWNPRIPHHRSRLLLCKGRQNAYYYVKVDKMPARIK
jgi:uncharacterized protein involved in tolerance to divalent cations